MRMLMSRSTNHIGRLACTASRNYSCREVDCLSHSHAHARMSGEPAENNLRRLRHSAKRIDVRLTRRLDADEREQESNDEGKQGLEHRHAESGIEDCGADKDGHEQAADPPESRHLLRRVCIVILIRRLVTSEHGLGIPPTWSHTP
jgi:hypothetical protein